MAEPVYIVEPEIVPHLCALLRRAEERCLDQDDVDYDGNDHQIFSGMRSELERGRREFRRGMGFGCVIGLTYTPDWPGPDVPADVVAAVERLRARYKQDGPSTPPTLP